ncbi:LuxR C-terminal-related transcriptional regulator [Balneolales bacterium ANBcel1]|nr:LuxR C-terminal-related transcriptional regulator [Balneolales bacterium ANBcel1]
MDWLYDSIDGIKQHRFSVGDPEMERKETEERIKSFFPVGNQFVFAVNYDECRIPYISDGISEMLGYDVDEVDDLSFFYDITHPDDLEAVKALTIRFLSVFCGNIRLEPLKHVFHIVYRLRRQDGRYIRVQLQTGMLTHDANHAIVSSFGIFTDVSLLHGSDEVRAYMTGPGIPNFNFSNGPIPSGAHFTRREREIVALMGEGLSSEAIAKKLFISIQTVNTHRKNILHKAGVKNSAGLMAYFFRHGF